MLRMLARAGLAGFFGAALSISVQAQEPPALQGKSLEEKARLAALIEGAKKEGAVSYWDAIIQPETNDALTAAFKKKYGLPNSFRVNYTLSVTVGLITRVEQETGANQVTIDIAAVGSPAWVFEMVRADRVMKYDSPEYAHYKSVFDQGLGQDGYFAFNGAYMFVPMWSEDHTKFSGKSYKDALEAVPPGRMSIGDAVKSATYLTTFEGQRKALGDDFFRALAKRKPPEEGGSRIAIIFNGSPLFSGGAGSGPSEIRRWILQNDWLEAVVALPEQLFYNTGIATYVWVLSNRKAPERQGKVQLIDARELWEPMPKSLGDKRRRLALGHIDEVLDLYRAFEDGERSKILPNEAFMYRRITVERPLRLRYEITGETVERLQESKAFQTLANPPANAKDAAAATERGQAAQTALLETLRALRGFRTTDRAEAEAKVRDLLRAVKKPTAALRKALWDAISIPDARAPIVTDAEGNPKPDTELRDYENVPLGESIDDYVAQEVLQFTPDAWVDHTKERLGAEIPFTRTFYRYKPPRSLDIIDYELAAVEAELRIQLRGVRQ